MIVFAVMGGDMYFKRKYTGCCRIAMREKINKGGKRVIHRKGSTLPERSPI